MSEKYCRNYGLPGCKKEIDSSYTMNFDDIGEEPLYWCSKCGEDSHKLATVLEQAISIRGPEFIKSFADALDKAEAEIIHEESN